jgi:predicted RNA-binding protein with PIN domain
MTPYEKLINAAVEYLQSEGFRVAVIGDTKVQHWPEDRKHNHELVIKFLGVQGGK